MRKLHLVLFVVVLLMFFTSTITVNAKNEACYTGQGFGWRQDERGEGHHFVWFTVNQSAYNWRVKDDYRFVPNAHLWNPPDRNGYAEAGFKWADGIPIPFGADVYRLCGSV